MPADQVCYGLSLMLRLPLTEQSVSSTIKDPFSGIKSCCNSLRSYKDVLNRFKDKEAPHEVGFEPTTALVTRCALFRCASNVALLVQHLSLHNVDRLMGVRTCWPSRS